MMKHYKTIAIEIRKTERKRETENANERFHHKMPTGKGEIAIKMCSRAFLLQKLLRYIKAVSF